MSAGNAISAGGVPVTDLHHASVTLAGTGNNSISLVTTAVGSGYEVADLDGGGGLNRTYDPNGLVNTADNSITIINAGTYRIFGSGNTNSADPALSLYVNGTRVAGGKSNNNSSLDDTVCFDLFLDLSAGDKVELGVSNTSASLMFMPSFSVQQLASVSVLDASSVTADDQSALNYVDIGAMRIAWGSQAQNAGAVTFPGGGFAAAPTVTASSQNGDVYIGVGSPSATGFTPGVYNFQGAVNNSVPFMWQAIGLKP